MPPTVVTFTSTTPALSAGAVAVMLVALFTVKPVAAVPPNDTAVAPLKLVPAMVTLVPPPSGPALGNIDVTMGAGTKVN